MIHMDIAINGAGGCVSFSCVYVCLCKPQTGFCKHSYLSSGKNSCHFDVAFRQVCVRGMSNANKNFWLTLLSFASCIFQPSFLLLPRLPRLSYFLSFSQMLPSFTSSTARPPRTLRSCARLAPMSSQCAKNPPHPLLLRLLLPADPFLPYLLSGTPTRCPAQALLPVSKACLSLSPPNVKADLPPHVCPSLSHSRQRCGGSCLESGTVQGWRSSQRTRGDYRR